MRPADGFQHKPNISCVRQVTRCSKRLQPRPPGWLSKPAHSRFVGDAAATSRVLLIPQASWDDPGDQGLNHA